MIAKNILKFSLCSLCMLFLIQSKALAFDYSITKAEVPVLTPEQEEKLEQLLNGDLGISDIQDESLWLHLRGGDIIGNGGGIVESQFEFAYQNLYKYIQEYLITNRPLMDINDYVALASIANIRNQMNVSDFALIFIDEENGLFDNTDIPHRTAMTGNYPGAPILINRSQLYDPISGKALLYQEDAVAILIHEIGHQAGIENHSYLDQLGNYVKSFIVDKTMRISKELDNNEIVSFIVKNPIEESLLYEAQIVTSTKIYDVKEYVDRDLKCPEGMRLHDIVLWNLHWLRSKSDNDVHVGLWTDILCEEIESESLYSYRVDIAFEITL